MLTELDGAQCRQLLSEQLIGRLGWASATGQIIVPVNYLYRDGILGFRTATASALAELRQPTPVAFEVDELDPMGRTGRSVLVRGTTRIAHERGWMWPPWAADISTWAGGNRPLAIEIEIEHISGRSVRPV